MPPTRRTLLTATAMAGSLVAGCNSSQEPTASVEYELYVRNDTDRPYELTVDVLNDADNVIFSTGDGDLFSPRESDLFGPFTGQVARIRIQAGSLHEDEEPRVHTRSYRPPDEECSETVLNRLFLEADGTAYETSCKEQ